MFFKLMKTKKQAKKNIKNPKNEEKGKAINAKQFITEAKSRRKFAK